MEDANKGDGCVVMVMLIGLLAVGFFGVRHLSNDYQELKARVKVLEEARSEKK